MNCTMNYQMEDQMDTASELDLCKQARNLIYISGTLLDIGPQQTSKTGGHYTFCQVSCNGTVHMVQCWDEASNVVQGLKRNSNVSIKGFLCAYQKYDNAPVNYVIKTKSIMSQRADIQLVGTVQGIMNIGDSTTIIMTCNHIHSNRRDVPVTVYYSGSLRDYIDKGDTIIVYGIPTVSMSNASINSNFIQKIMDDTDINID